MQNQGYETVPFLLQSRQILSVQINFYTGSGLSLLFWKTALDYTGLDREPIVYIFFSQRPKKVLLKQKTSHDKKHILQHFILFDYFFRYYPIASNNFQLYANCHSDCCNIHPHFHSINRILYPFTNVTSFTNIPYCINCEQLISNMFCYFNQI